MFFLNIKSYQTKEKPKQFDIRTLLPKISDRECAEKVADHFNAISAEFAPLEPGQIPMTFSEKLPELVPFQVAGRLRAFRKPKSLVWGICSPSSSRSTPIFWRSH